MDDRGTAAVAELSSRERASLRPADVVALQRTLGNAATASLLAGSAPHAPRGTEARSSSVQVQRFLTKGSRRRLRKAFGRPKKLKPTSAELLADPTAWDESKVGSVPTTKPKKKLKKARDERLGPTDTKSEGEKTEEKSEQDEGKEDSVRSEQDEGKEDSVRSEQDEGKEDSVQSEQEEKEAEEPEGEQSAEESADDMAARLADLLAGPKELKAATPYSETKQRDKEYEGEDTEGMKELEPRFIGPARRRVLAALRETGPEDEADRKWVTESTPVIKQARQPGGKLAHLSEAALLKKFMTQQLKTLIRWTPEEVEKYIDDQGFLRTDKDNKALVKYLGPTERAQYELHNESGVFTQGDGKEPFTTASMGTNFSGSGYGIFAMNTAGQIYAESHKVGLFHHSTFLAGGEVAAAGELKVVGGTLEHVTNKTGHYKAEAVHLAQAVERFRDWGISPDSFDVSVIDADTKKTDVKRVKASTFLSERRGGA